MGTDINMKTTTYLISRFLAKTVFAPALVISLGLAGCGGGGGGGGGGGNN